MRALQIWFVALLGIVNLVLYLVVVRPIKRVVRVADRLSMGDTAVAPFPAGGATEVSELSRAFERMRKSLDKAMKLLGS
jgi:protein-histidine pros-kinase